MENDELIPTAVVRKILGVTDRTICRWQKDERIGFPAPTIINERKYWTKAEISRFCESMRARTARGENRTRTVGRRNALAA